MNTENLTNCFITPYQSLLQTTKKELEAAEKTKNMAVAWDVWSRCAFVRRIGQCLFEWHNAVVPGYALQDFFNNEQKQEYKECID